MTETAVFGVFYRASSRSPAAADVAALAEVDRQTSERSLPGPIISVPLSGSKPITPNSSAPQRGGETSIFPRYAGPAEPLLSEATSRPINQEPDNGQRQVFDLSQLVDLVVACQADQLGLAHPAAISLKVRLPGFESLELDATSTGVYRPASLHSGSRPMEVLGKACSLRVGLAAGTRILTSHGEMEVQDLVSGDIVLALRGPALLPILPVVKTASAKASVAIEAAAFGPGLPRRLLQVGPDQPIFLAPVPVAAHTLVNGQTIRFVADDTELFCVNFGETEIVLAEGVPMASADQAGTPHS